MPPPSPLPRPRGCPPPARAVDARASRGFTFIELMSASAVFLFGLSGLLSMDAASTKLIAQAQHQIRATALASNTAALCALLPLGPLRAMGTAQSLSYDNEGALQVGGSSNVFYIVSVRSLSNATGGLDVRVQVDWTEPSTGLARHVTLQNAVPIP